MMCEHKCIKFCILTKGFYYFDSNSHRRRGLIGPTDGLYEKSEMLLHILLIPPCIMHSKLFQQTKFPEHFYELNSNSFQILQTGLSQSNV